MEVEVVSVKTVILDPHIRRAGLIGTGALNLGEKDNFRVPDRAVHRSLPKGTFPSTAAVVVEILSDHDETFEKFGFYAAHGVEELLVVDPRARTVRCWHLVDGEYAPRPGSTVLDVSRDEISGQIDWPPAED
jgi:Uma2 family endonuclease